jgi:dihydroorotase (multifunctional complex type)
VCLFAHLVGARIHVFHVSSREGLDAIEQWRGKGVDVTAEATPHHCFLTAEDMHRWGSLMRVNPPVREPGHGQVLLKALSDGRLDAIATDHAPHTREEKLHADIWQAVSGFAGVETSVRLFLTHAVNAGRMTLQQYVRLTSEGPARVWGLYPQKGSIRVGSDADLTIVDLHKQGQIQAATLHSKNNYTPFEGQYTRGEAVATILSGRLAMRDGELVGEPRGRMVRGAAQPRGHRHSRQPQQEDPTHGLRAAREDRDRRRGK